MAEEQIIKLLEEIRDLHVEHLTSYKEAVKNQQQAIDLQKASVRRQKLSVIVLAVFLSTIVIVVVWSVLASHT